MKDSEYYAQRAEDYCKKADQDQTIQSWNQQCDRQVRIAQVYASLAHTAAMKEAQEAERKQRRDKESQP